MLDQSTEIRPLGGISAGKHTDRSPHFGELREQGESLIGGKLFRRAVGDGFGSAMAAGQVAGPCCLPDGDKRRLIKIYGGRLRQPGMIIVA